MDALQSALRWAYNQEAGPLLDRADRALIMSQDAIQPMMKDSALNDAPNAADVESAVDTEPIANDSEQRPAVMQSAASSQSAVSGRGPLVELTHVGPLLTMISQQRGRPLDRFGNPLPFGTNGQPRGSIGFREIRLIEEGSSDCFYQSEAEDPAAAGPADAVAADPKAVESADVESEASDASMADDFELVDVCYICSCLSTFTWFLCSDVRIDRISIIIGYYRICNACSTVMYDMVDGCYVICIGGDLH